MKFLLYINLKRLNTVLLETYVLCQYRFPYFMILETHIGGDNQPNRGTMIRTNFLLFLSKYDQPVKEKEISQAAVI